MQRYLTLTVCLLFVMAYANAALATEITRGIMLSNSCAACHGTDGRSPGAIPSINGNSSKFIAQALHDFREGSRAATVMGRHATGYTDDEILSIADFFSSQP